MCTRAHQMILSMFLPLWLVVSQALVPSQTELISLFQSCSTSQDQWESQVEQILKRFGNNSSDPPTYKHVVIFRVGLF